MPFLVVLLFSIFSICESTHGSIVLSKDNEILVKLREKYKDKNREELLVELQRIFSKCVLMSDVLESEKRALKIRVMALGFGLGLGLPFVFGAVFFFLIKTGRITFNSDSKSKSDE